MIKKTIAFLLVGSVLNFVPICSRAEFAVKDMEIEASNSVTNEVYSKEKDYGKYFDAFMKYVKTKYKDDVPEEKLLEGAFKGMLSGLDNFTEFLNMDEANELLEEIEGNYKGIGVLISKVESGEIVIGQVFMDSPAFNAGFIEGDRIISINGKSVLEMNVEEVANNIKGPDGSKVVLKFLRGTKEHEVTVSRADVKINPVSYRIVDDIGYIKLESFNINAYSEMKKAFSRELESLTLI